MIDYGFGVTLGPLSDLNLNLYYKWRNDYLIYKWCRQYEPLTWKAHVDWFNALSSRDDVKMWEIRDGGEPIGVCGLTDINYINSRAEFSLYICSDAHGCGLGKKALLTLLAHGFLAINLNRIWGETFDGNPAAKVFEKIGMTNEGRRIDFYYRRGRYIDAMLYSIGRKEFLATYQPTNHK
jgi:RimJ/RimL family protein N-acetyltransferase